MSLEITPTTEEVRGSYQSYVSEYRGTEWEQAVLDFDRWLAAHDAEVAKGAVLEYVLTRDTPTIMVKFTNQPVFDAAIRAARVKELRDLAEEWKDKQGMMWMSMGARTLLNRAAAIESEVTK